MTKRRESYRELFHEVVRADPERRIGRLELIKRRPEAKVGEKMRTEKLICLNCQEEFTVVVQPYWDAELGGWRPSYCKPCDDLIKVMELTDIPEHI